MTFVAEHYQDGKVWLCTMNKAGDVKKLAVFENEEAVRSFFEVLALAKAAAHAHGMNGI